MSRSRGAAELAVMAAFLAAALAAVLTACGAPAGSQAGSPADETRGDPGAAGQQPSGQVVVLAASSLTETFTELGERFEAEHPGVKVVLSFGGSSGLAQQVLSGAPADVFAAASTATMSTVEDAGVAARPVVFARNQLEIAVPKSNPGRVEGLADLADPGRTIALCAPQVPCGTSSEKLFAGAGLEPAPDTLEQDVKAVLTKVELGEVDAGLVYRTDIQAAGEAVEGVPVTDAPAVVNDYPVAVLDGAPNPAAASAFVELLLAEEGRAVLTAAGFDVP